MNVKIFIRLIETSSFLEHEINDWLKENSDIKIKFITQSSSSIITTVSIFYEPKEKNELKNTSSPELPKYEKGAGIAI